jgi:hypothetical protein
MDQHLWRARVYEYKIIHLIRYDLSINAKRKIGTILSFTSHQTLQTGSINA